MVPQLSEVSGAVAVNGSVGIALWLKPENWILPERSSSGDRYRGESLTIVRHRGRISLDRVLCDHVLITRVACFGAPKRDE